MILYIGIMHCNSNQIITKGNEIQKKVLYLVGVTHRTAPDGSAEIFQIIIYGLKKRTGPFTFVNAVAVLQ